MKDELGGKIMTKFVGSRAKNYDYLKDDGCEDKKAKSTKKCAIKRKLTFENYKLFRNNSTWEQNKSFRKNKIDIDSIKENYKEFIKK